MLGCFCFCSSHDTSYSAALFGKTRPFLSDFCDAALSVPVLLTLTFRCFRLTLGHQETLHLDGEIRLSGLHGSRCKPQADVHELKVAVMRTRSYISCSSWELGDPSLVYLPTSIKHQIFSVTSDHPRAMSQHAVDRMAQRRIEEVSEADHDAPAPPYKRRKLSQDLAVQSYTGTSYENTHTHDNARAHYGDVFNNYMGQAQPPFLPHTPSSSFQDSQSNGLDASRWIQALRFDHMDSRFLTMSSAHHGTCEWLFKREEYKAWRNPDRSGTHHGFLCIKGKPATGKSTLMRSAYLHGMNIFSEDAIVSYFFGLGGPEAPSHAEGFYRSILCQLLVKLPELSAVLQKHTRCLSPSDQQHVVWAK